VICRARVGANIFSCPSTLIECFHPAKKLVGVFEVGLLQDDLIARFETPLF
jgi:hypothetical protein